MIINSIEMNSKVLILKCSTRNSRMRSSKYLLKKRKGVQCNNKNTILKNKWESELKKIVL